MHRKPRLPLAIRRFYRDLRRADPLFWLVAALVALIFFFRWLTFPT